MNPRAAIRVVAFSSFLLSLCTAIAASAGASVPSAGDASAKIPIPRAPALSKADHELREKYKMQFARRTIADDLALAQKLRDQAAAHEDDPPLRFVMLRAARELLLSAGDVDAALSAVDEMAAVFTIDVRDMKLAAMAVAVDKTLAEPAVLTATYLRLGDRFLSEGDVDLAEHACRLAENVLHNHRKIKDADLESRWKEQHKNVQIAMKETQAVVGAMRKLKANADDAEAATIVGKYASFYRGLWDQGLPLLAKSSDTRLKALAEQELTNPSDPAAIATLADGWWEYAGVATTPITRDRIHRHAVEWYQKALPGLSGERKQLAAQRISESAH